MTHGNQANKQKKRKMQLLQAAKKYNTSVKGKTRARKYEASTKAFKRR